MREVPEDAAVLEMVSRIMERSGKVRFRARDTGRKAVVSLFNGGEECVRAWFKGRRNGEVFLHIDPVGGVVADPGREVSFKVRRHRGRTGVETDHPDERVLERLCVALVLVATATPDEVMGATRRGMGMDDEALEAWRKAGPGRAPWRALRVLVDRVDRVVRYESKTVHVQMGKRIVHVRVGKPDDPALRPSPDAVQTGIYAFGDAWYKVPHIVRRQEVSKMREVFRRLQAEGFELDGVKRVWDEELVRGVMRS